MRKISVQSLCVKENFGMNAKTNLKERKSPPHFYESLPPTKEESYINPEAVLSLLSIIVLIPN